VVLPGITHTTDAVALQAQIDATTAYGILATEPSTADLSTLDLGGMTLTPGVYTFFNIGSTDRHSYTRRSEQS